MKKFLALVLALVMTMSLVTISAGAEDFTDADEMNYPDAVEVMAAIEVVGGYADGSFNPTAGLTRGAAAKIICNMILGPTTAEALSANDAPYSDVPVDNVFAGYIAYCANEGIISGYADGTFRPAAPLTGYAFMKMLLGALGYDAAIEGYTGANWSIQVAKRALNIGLDAGLKDDFVGAKALTREEACLYAFNTLKADMVKYDSKSTISVGDIVISQNSEASVVVDSDRNNIWEDDGATQFAEKYFKKLSVKVDDVDAYGRPAATWTYKKDTVGTYAVDADFVYVNEFDADIIEDLEDDKYVMPTTAEIVYNGAASANDIEWYMAGDDAANGFTIELYDTDDDKNFDAMVVIEEYFAQVGKFTAANEKKDTEAKVVLKVFENKFPSGKEITIVDDPDSDTDAYDKLAAFEKDDYVAVVAKQGWEDNATILAVSELEAVEGKIQKVTEKTYVCTSSVKMDGTTYGLNNECVGVKGTVKATDEGTLYLDAQGCVIGWVAKTESVSDKAIAVSDVFNTLEDGKIVTMVEGYLSNGEKTTLKVAKNAQIAAFEVYTYADEDEDGIYELTAEPKMDFANGATYAFSAEVKKNDKSFYTGAAYYASDLKVIYVDAEDEEITVKEGKQDIAAGLKYATIGKDGDNLMVTAIFVEAAPAAGTATADSLIYVAKAAGTISIEVDEKDETFYVYEAYVDGEQVEDFYATTSGVAAGFYKNVKDDETGAYILVDKEYESDDEIAVATVEVTKYAAGVVNGVYGVADAVVNDLSTGFDGIEVGATVAMIIDAETNDALYVYVLD